MLYELPCPAQADECDVCVGHGFMLSSLQTYQLGTLEDILFSCCNAAEYRVRDRQAQKRQLEYNKTSPAFFSQIGIPAPETLGLAACKFQDGEPHLVGLSEVENLVGNRVSKAKSRVP